MSTGYKIKEQDKLHLVFRSVFCYAEQSNRKRTYSTVCLKYNLIGRTDMQLTTEPMRGYRSNRCEAID
jgi:hypothetical protein